MPAPIKIPAFRQAAMNLSRTSVWCAALICVFQTITNELYANEKGPSVPEEYESTGGHSLAFGGSVATGIGGTSAIRANPALLALEKEYSVNGAYHWPTAGRDYYQVGIVDGKTSGVAAGFTYTGAIDNYQGIASKNPAQDDTVVDPYQITLSKDSPVIRRMGLAAAFPIGKLYTGISGSYVEAKPPGETLQEEGGRVVKGLTMGFGFAAHITEALRVGLSAENIANKKVQYAAPTFYRAGVSYFVGSSAVINLDYRRREAIPVYEGAAPSIALVSSASGRNDTLTPENMLNASTSIKVYDLIRLVASAGQTRSGDEAKTRAAGGVSLVNQKFSFSYQALRPDLKEEAVHHALSLGIDVAM